MDLEYGFRELFVGFLALVICGFFIGGVYVSMVNEKEIVLNA